MYLKSIEVQGFKSFANKIVFEFPSGITGIVGPNGSGKSNVADAVRWVLGEQKIKQLRGNKMEDVIFAGTAQRKPLSYAFVAITLDNSDHKLKIDFDEVIVSRRVYRSGESEYMINGSVCRLRDVQELFYDTGIGKEGYSIIGQGQIDKILQGKPEERRELFDEAAGIVKYKKRKNIAMRKLESERLNLSRVSDILSELKRQVGPLERQSIAAEKFVVFKNDLKKYDINLFLLENGDIKEKIKEYDEKEKSTREELSESRTLLENTKEEYEKISVAIQELEEKISAVKDRISQCDILKESFAGQINVLNEQINSANEAEKTFNERITDLNAQLKSAEEEKDRLSKERDENQKALLYAVNKKNSQDSYVLDIQNKNEEIRQSIEKKKEELVELVKKNGEINARKERLLALSEQMSKRKEELSLSLEKYSSDKQDQENKVKDLEKEFEEASHTVNSHKEQIDSKDAALKNAINDIKVLSLEYDQAREKLIKDEAALESLRNITERYEGYGNTIKEIMKLKENNSGIHGVVADIIRTEKKYEVAIETALGGNIQNVVTDTENTAKEVIEYLKKNKLGRATFLPLKAVTGRGEFKNTDVLSEDGILGLASSLVEVDEKYKGVANYLLGKIVVAENIDKALVIARKYNYSLIIVTLEGELLNRGGSLSGGAYKNKSNLLGRRREIQEYEDSIKALKEKLENNKKKIAEAEGIRDDAASELSELKAALQEHIIFLNTIKVNLNSAKEKQSEISGYYDSFDKESKSIDEQKGNISSENVSLDDELKSNAEKDENTKKEIIALEDELSDMKAKEAEELLKAQTLIVEHSRLNEQNSFLVNSLIRAENLAEKLSSDISSLIKNNENSAKNILEKQESIKDIERALEECSAEQSALNDERQKLEGEKAERTSSHRDFINRRDEYAEKVSNLDKEAFRLASLKEKLEERFENKANYIWDEYQMTYNSALSLRDEELIDAKEMREKIAELKTSIRGLGNINVGAIEEYKEVKERYDFYSGQHADLLKAEADLLKIIKDLDKEMRKQFNEEFKKIKAEFSKVFKEMFGGGNGTIELEEDVDVLDAGISIIAQPPGKKLQNMMQLSGGEKALTAIAVLFAIQNLKPSPFCILDEIEAALDDSNIERFAEYLHRLSSDIQFIVITHRKGTMEAADRLYGITMQERGVSTLISVNLADIVDEPAG